MYAFHYVPPSFYAIKIPAGIQCLHIILHTYQTLWALRDWQVVVTSSVAECVATKEVPLESRPVAHL